MKLPLDSYFFKFRGVGSDKAAELVATIQDEANELFQIVLDESERAVKKARKRLRRRLG